MASLSTDKCLYGGTLTLQYNSGELPVYIYLEGAGVVKFPNNPDYHAQVYIDYTVTPTPPSNPPPTGKH